MKASEVSERLVDRIVNGNLTGCQIVACMDALRQTDWIARKSKLSAEDKRFLTKVLQALDGGKQ